MYSITSDAPIVAHRSIAAAGTASALLTPCATLFDIPDAGLQQSLQIDSRLRPDPMQVLCKPIVRGSPSVLMEQLEERLIVIELARRRQRPYAPCAPPP
jgi:hypothetical protein